MNVVHFSAPLSTEMYHCKWKWSHAGFPKIFTPFITGLVAATVNIVGGQGNWPNWKIIWSKWEILSELIIRSHFFCNVFILNTLNLICIAHGIGVDNCHKPLVIANKFHIIQHQSYILYQIREYFVQVISHITKHDWGWFTMLKSFPIVLKL